MAEFLSQDEIDALLDIAEDGEENLDEINVKSTVAQEKRYTIYDFKKPNTITADQQKSFEALHDKMIRAVVTDLSSMLRKVVEVKITSIEQMTYGEFVLSIPPVTSINTLSMKPLEGRLVMECNPAISHKIIAELLGNGASYTSNGHDRELSDIELEVLNHFYRLLVDNMTLVWDEIATLNFKTVTQDTNANSIQVISNHEIIMLVTIEITIDEEVGNVSICYPIAYIEPLFNKIVEKMLGSSRNKKISKKQDLNTLLSGAKMNVEAVIAETNLSVKELLNLKKGDIILFNKNSTSSNAKIYINKKEKFASIAGISSNRKAVQIKTNVDHEKMDTLEKLKILREKRDIEQHEQDEKIARLIDTRDDFL
jgi:flagellar motor switch protein FliM